MMNIKNLDPYKKEFKEFLEIMPVSQMEFTIQSSGNPLIKKLYDQLLAAKHEIQDPYYLEIFHKAGILGIYVFMDPCYGDVIRWMLSDVTKEEINAKPSRLWRINTVYMEQNKCE